MTMMINYKEEVNKDTTHLLNVRDEYQSLSIPELQNITKKDRKKFSLSLLNVTGDLNIGVAVRTAHLLGAKEVFIFGRRKYDIRSTVDADKYFPVHKIAALKDDLTIDPDVVYNTLCVENSYEPILLEHGGIPINKYLPNRNFSLIIGNEGRGIDQEILDRFCNFSRVSIPQLGVMRSYNASAAASIAMYELSRKT